MRATSAPTARRASELAAALGACRQAFIGVVDQAYHAFCEK